MNMDKKKKWKKCLITCSVLVVTCSIIWIPMKVNNKFNVFHQIILTAWIVSVYSIIELQPAGKQKMDITSYLNGVGQGLKIGQRIIEDEE